MTGAAQNSGADRTCLNCGALVQGDYCQDCGQKFDIELDSLLAFLVGSLPGIVRLRSRTTRSLVDLVIRPGSLTKAYIQGRRTWYTQPVQLYLIAAAVFFVANSFRPFVRMTDDNRVISSLSAASTGTELSETQLADLEASGVTMEVFRERFESAVSQSLPPFMLGSIIAFALALKAFGPRRPLLHHVVAALHWIAFFMLVMAVERLIPFGWTQFVFAQVTLVHLVVSLRIGFGYRWPRAAVSGFALLVVFNLILVVWVLSVVALALAVTA